MRTGQKIAIVILAAVAILFLGWGAVWASIQSAGGMAYISVDPGHEGPSFRVAVPMAVVEGLAMAGQTAVDRIEVDGRPLRDYDHEIEEWAPLAMAVIDVLADSPDATFVEVEDGRSHVSVVKRRGQLVVEVQDRDEAYEISIPMRSAARIARRLVG
jgi:hypothetical protein